MIQTCIPHTGTIEANLVDWMITNGVKPFMERSYSVCRGRNNLMNRFLTDSKAEWLFYLDSDMWPATDKLFEFVESQPNDVQVLLVPGITNKLRWNFSIDDSGELIKLKDYNPKGLYNLKPIKTFGGSGIFLRRSLVEKLPKNIWRDPNNEVTGEDILFSYTLTQTYKVPAYLIDGSALHHQKGGFDLHSLVGNE
jgi:hypothetical protein